MAAPTLLDLITEVLTDIGEIGPGTTPSPEDSAYCMGKANEMLASNSTERMNIYSLQILPLLLTAKQTFAIGPGAGDFNQTRPLKVEGAVISIPMAVTSAPQTSPLEIIGEARWRMISDLSATTNAPEMMYPDYASPVMHLNFYPAPRCLVPTTAQLTVWTALQQFLALTDPLAMPPGYQSFLVENLKVVIMQAYGHPVDGFTAQQAATYKQRIQQFNAQTPDLALFNGIPSPTPPTQ